MEQSIPRFKCMRALCTDITINFVVAPLAKMRQSNSPIHHLCELALLLNLIC